MLNNRTVFQVHLCIAESGVCGPPPAAAVSLSMASRASGGTAKTRLAKRCGIRPHCLVLHMQECELGPEPGDGFTTRPNICVQSDLTAMTRDLATQGEVHINTLLMSYPGTLS